METYTHPAFREMKRLVANAIARGDITISKPQSIKPPYKGLRERKNKTDAWTEEKRAEHAKLIADIKAKRKAEKECAA